MSSPALAFPRRTRAILLALILASLSGVGWLRWLCLRSDDIAFLPARKGAEWIVCPEPSNGYAYPEAPATTTFRHTFSLNATPASAVLEVCAFKSTTLAINGQLVAGTLHNGQHWKSPSTLEVARLLRAGTNDITAWVTNSLAPPALWLRLQAGQLMVGTDERWQAFRAWEGWQNAHRARQPQPITPDSSLSGGERTLDSIKRAWPAVAAFCVGSLVLVLVAGRWVRRRSEHLGTPSHVTSAKLMYGLLAIVLIARAALLINNLPQLPRTIGFDTDGHEDYIRFIQQNHSLPLAQQGWEMYQPPLYYAGSALVLEACKLSLPDDRARLLARLVNGVAGLIQCWLALLCLRLLFPGKPAAQAAGLLVAAFLPPHLYLSHYVTNEPLGGLVMTLALYLCLRTLCAEKESVRLQIALGLALGLAMLTKSSALLAVPVFLTALGLRLFAGKCHAPRDCLRTLAAVILPCLLVCGWYYGRVWAQFGRPIVGNWDADAGLAWWQDPGFRTSAFYCGFGHALVSPLFSGFHSFADGLYSTLWGDGLISGTVRMISRPPWDYDLMGVAYLLALGNSLLLITGMLVTFTRFIRRLAVEWFLVLGLVSVFGLGILYMSLCVPSYAQVKAFYGFPVLVPFSALIAAGWDWLQQKHRAGRALLWILLLVWSMASYTAFWVRRDNATTHLVRGIDFASSQRYPEAAASLARALHITPGLADAHTTLGQVLLEQGKVEEAIPHFSAALKIQPGHAEAHYHLGYALLRQQRTEPAISEFRQALRLRLDWSPETLNDMAWLLATHPDPDPRNRAETLPLAERACRLALHLKPTLPEGHHTLGVILVQQGALKEAAVQFAAAVHAQPDNAQAHYDLADAFLRQQRTEKAIPEYREALRLRADWPPEALNNMAWVLATHPEARLRDGAEALGLAQRACRLTGNSNISFLQTLAAAQAECAQFANAINTARQAYELALSTQQFAWTNLAKQRLDLYTAHKRIYEAQR
jgi:tetratricopeptide (TPR) repeat protein